MKSMNALPPKLDISRPETDVRFRPEADMQRPGARSSIAETPMFAISELRYPLIDGESALRQFRSTL